MEIWRVTLEMPQSHAGHCHGNQRCLDLQKTCIAPLEWREAPLWSAQCVERLVGLTCVSGWKNPSSSQLLLEGQRKASTGSAQWAPSMGLLKDWSGCRISMCLIEVFSTGLRYAEELLVTSSETRSYCLIIVISPDWVMSLREPVVSWMMAPCDGTIHVMALSMWLHYPCDGSMWWLYVMACIGMVEWQ